MSFETPKPHPASNNSSDTKPLPEQPSREKILQPEFTALATCLKSTVVKIGQIYSFYADARKLDIEKHVPNPPRSLTTALGRDIERYDQLCDSIEAHLLRAINVLKRDLRREEARIEAEARRKQAESLMLPPAPPTSSETPADIPSSQAPSEGSITNPRNSPVLSAASARRPSAISISSLHRPHVPLKLDLSATSLRITEEEAALYSKGLASPVTLAPKSARPVGPNEFPPDLMAAFAASSSGSLNGTHDSQNINLPLQPKLDLMDLGVGLGDSSDKPIELDLDAMDMEMANMARTFGNAVEAGESSNSNDGLFSPLLGEGDGQQLQENNIDPSSAQAGDASNNFNINSAATDELFGNLNSSSDLGMQDLHTSTSSILQPQASSVPSPRSLMAQFSDTSDLMNTKVSSSGNQVINNADNGFEIDLSNLPSEFFSNPSGGSDMQFMPMDMQAFLDSATGLDMDSTPENKGDASINKT